MTVFKASIEPLVPRWWVVPALCAVATFSVATSMALAALLGFIAASTCLFLARNSRLVFDRPDATNRDKRRFLVNCALSGVVGTPLILGLIAYSHAMFAALMPFPPLSFFAFATSFSVVAGLACLFAARKFS